MKKNIWIWNHYATDMYRDKAGRHYWFAKILYENGYRPWVFCANTFHSKHDSMEIPRGIFIKHDEENIPYVFIKANQSSGNGLGRLKNMVDFYLHLFPVTKMIKKEVGKPDVILASSVHPLTMVAGVQIAKKWKIPCICEIRDLWPETIFAFGKLKENSMLGKVLTKGEHWIYKNADALIFTKEGDTDYLKEKGWTTEQGGDVSLEKCYYINNGVNIKAFETSISENVLEDKDLEDDSFKVTYAGILRPINDVGKILDCAKILKNESEIKFLIYGDGNQYDMLKNRIEDEKINNVQLKGFVERKYIPYILNNSSVNILNYSQSKYNWTRGNSSNKLFEYMASGKPVISTVKMGYDIIDKYGCGMSLEKDTPENLANAILQIKKMDESQYQKLCMASKDAAKDFDFNTLVSKLMNVIESV